MKIGALATQAGVSVQAVRYYERRGLLPAPERTLSGYRDYDRSDVLRLSFVRRAKDLGFTLSEIRDLLELRVRHDTTAADVGRQATAKLEAIRSKIRALQSIAAALERVVSTCDANGSPEACALMHALESPDAPYAQEEQQ